MFERFKNLDRQTAVGLAVAAVVGILLFGAIAGVIRQAGWNEGFLFGLLASGGEGGKTLNPYLAHRYGYGWHPGWFIGGFFRFFFFAFLLLVFFKFLGFWRWRMHGGPQGRYWHHHGPWQEGPGPSAQPGQESQPAAGSAGAEENKPQNTSWTNV
ncbi:MAG: hypothetical protein DCC55_29250 [Chloroflexi bacterium]|nr:MAG: hypothetical protein DCC55_29250 [Chloroflexota bacterium]